VKEQAQNGFSVFCGILVFSFSVSYMVFVRDYKVALEKHAALTDYLNNPNVRVASGDKAKQLMAVIQPEEQPEVAPTPAE